MRSEEECDAGEQSHEPEARAEWPVAVADGCVLDVTPNAGMQGEHGMARALLGEEHRGCFVLVSEPSVSGCELCGRAGFELLRRMILLS